MTTENEMSGTEWTNEGMNRTNREDALTLAQKIANNEGRSVTVEHDTHGGYPAHYSCHKLGERFSSFGRHAFTIAPELHTNQRRLG